MNNQKRQAKKEKKIDIYILFFPLVGWEQFEGCLFPAVSLRSRLRRGRYGAVIVNTRLKGLQR